MSVFERLQGVFKETFNDTGTNVDLKMSRDGISTIYGWDSIKHVELMYTIENEFDINENKIVQNHKINDTQVLSNFFEALFEILGPVIVFFILLPALAIILFAFFLYELGGFHAFPFG